MLAKDFLARTERRRMLLLQRPPGVPVQPSNPIDDKTCYWLNKIQRRRQGPHVFADPPAKLTRNKSLPSAAAFNSYVRKSEEQRVYRILALDGGGVRGIITAVILQRLVGVFPGLVDNVDLIAGTSTGGLLACLMAGGYSTR
jgi:hypothetical protein